MSLPGQFLNYTVREPLGVVAGITPPNYPLTMPLYKAAPALATGNTIILKPSEDTSLVALRLGEIFLEAGLPEGVFNVVTGLGETAGAALAEHDDVDKITFTGSTEVGRAARARRRGQSEKGVARARRQIAEHRLRRRRSRSRAQGRVHGHLLLPGRDLLGRLAAVRRGDASTTNSSRGSPRWRAR